MKERIRTKILSCISAALILSGLVGIPFFVSADEQADQLANDIRSAAKAYVDDKGNYVTPEGLLEYVNEAISPKEVEMTFTVDPNTRAMTNFTDFYIKHAADGVTDDDPNPSTQLNIPGSDGAVAARFKVVGTVQSVGFTTPIPHKQETLSVAGSIDIVSDTSPNFTIDTTDANCHLVTGYKGTAKKIIFPDGFLGMMGVLSDKSQLDSVQVVTIRNRANTVPLKEDAFSGWNNLIALDIHGGKSLNLVYGGLPNYHRELLTQKAIHDCPNLKYLWLPYLLGTPVPTTAPGSFSNLPKLEVLGSYRADTSVKTNLPLYCNISGDNFLNTSVWDIYQDASQKGNITGGNVFFSPSFGTNGVRNITVTGSTAAGSTAMSLTRAAALMQAKAYEMEYLPSMTDTDVTNALKLAVSSVRNVGADYANTMTCDWGGTWSNSGSIVRGTLTVSDSTGVEIPITFKRILEQGLKSLSVSGGYMLEPKFDNEVLDYTITVPNNVTSLTVNAEAVSGNVLGTITSATGIVEGNSVSGLVVGNSNVISIPVTLEDSGKMVYSITVTRLGGSFDEADDVADALKSLTYTDKTYQEDLEEEIESVLNGTGVNFEVSEYYIYKSIAGAKEGSNVIVPGYDGYVAAVVTLTKGTDIIKIPVKGVISATMNNYSFTVAETAKESDFLLSSDGKTLLEYSGDAKKVVIPEGVEEMDDWWMAGYSENIEMLILPDSLKKLPTDMGNGMFHLQACYMGDSITEIPPGAFQKCYSLRHLRVSENLQIIGSQAFRHCASLGDIYLPDSLRKISDNAFYESLPRNFTLPKDMNAVSNNVFSWPNVRGTYYSDGAVSAIVPKNEVASLNQYIWPFAYDLPYDPTNYTASSSEAQNQIAHRVPRVITVLGSGSVFANANAFTTDHSGGWAPIKVRAAAGSPTAILLSGKNYFEALNMTLSEMAARAQVKADSMPLSNETTADGIIATIKSAYFSNIVSENIVWKENFELTPFIKDTQQGHVTGVLEISGAGGITFEVALNRTFGASVQVEPYVPQTPTVSPLSVKPDSKKAIINADTKTIKVLKDTTVADLLKDLVLQDGYSLKFYSEKGDLISEADYNSYVLTSGCTVKIFNADGSEYDILTIAGVDSVDNPKTGEATTTGAAVLLLLTLTTVGITLRKKKMKT